MASPATRKPIMTLYSGTSCLHSHSCRIVLSEKAVECRVCFIDPKENPEELADLNPYQETPTLVDRDLALYSAKIINEYLDERLPHPPLMPVDPVSRARARLMMMRLQRDWFDRLSIIEEGERRQANKARQHVRDGLISISPIFDEQAYMLGQEFSLLDCVIAPLLWRLPLYNIELPRQAKPLTDYADKLFQRKSFTESLSEIEQEMRT